MVLERIISISVLCKIVTGAFEHGLEENADVFLTAVSGRCLLTF